MTANHPPLPINSFIIACIVALILLPAAVLKWAYPPSHGPILYMTIGAIEAFLALCVLMYYKSWRVWAFLALTVSTWAGFSFYVTLFDLPCSCMGGSLHLPNGTSLALNGVMFLGALRVLHGHPTYRIEFKRLIWFFSILFIAGFITAVVYYNYRI